MTLYGFVYVVIGNLDLYILQVMITQENIVDLKVCNLKSAIKKLIKMVKM